MQLWKKLFIIMNIQQQTLASIAIEHHQLVPVLEKYHLDFCCGGKQTLAEACNERGLDITAIIKELKTSDIQDQKAFVDFSDMNAEQLIRYILIKHHFYTRQSMPDIEAHLTKVAAKHGERYPYMRTVKDLFAYLKNDMYMHMQKEEMVLFPRIKEIAASFNNKTNTNKQQEYINDPVTMMVHEHDEAGAIMEQIRILTSDYSIPEDACNTFKIVLQELKAFEEDLHKHVHLENNLLFPMAEKMIEQSAGQAK
ncbi:MAG: iron-sulfur cluster repair di-iron protein [Sphingobacteriales bacterium 40-81]|nr:MAG: iron-sulfur cluster repair di-iron protein [Sphingobacteriales bacterium 40-81]